MTASNVILVITATCTALIAGLLYAYSCSVIPGLKPLPDTEYIATMQSINKAIQNPVFFISFMGTLVLLPITTYMHYSQPLSQRFCFLLAGAVVYIIGVFGVTVFGNVPLNNTLEKFDLLHSSAESIRLQRVQFEGPWISWHTIRTIASVIALILVITGCINPDKSH